MAEIDGMTTKMKNCTYEIELMKMDKELMADKHDIDKLQNQIYSLAPMHLIKEI